MVKRFSGTSVAIVDYGMGNLFSVQRACERVGLNAKLAHTPESLLAADGVILPGVGAMPEAMRVLAATGLAEALRTCAARGTPLFGICLGMQLFMREGDEFGRHEGLGILPGAVRRFEGQDDEGRPLRVPHIGWSPILRPAGSSSHLAGDAWNGTPLAGIQEGESMYFVHSYYVVPDDHDLQISATRYGDVQFCSALARGNVFGCQFHPERSGEAGLRMYATFAQLIGSPAPKLEAQL